MRAIETSYNGILFRSKTEARWAVFFDRVGVKWKYEHEGYDLPSGKYLPDFWLPDVRQFLEIKGRVPTEQELRLGLELIGDPAKHGVFFAIGDPDDRNILRVAYEWEGQIQVEPSHAAMCIRCQRRDSFSFSMCPECLFCKSNGMPPTCTHSGWGGCDDCWHISETETIPDMIFSGRANKLIAATRAIIDDAINVSRVHRFWNPPGGRP